MPVIQSGIKQNEGFLVQLNGNYDILFDEVEVTGTFESGTILENATTAVSSTSTEVLGIVAEDTTGTKSVRVMTRGNPSTVNAKALVYGTAVKADIDALMAEKDIVVINQ